LHRQKVREQAAVEEIDRKASARHVGAPHVLVAGGQLRFADIDAIPPRRHDQLGNRRRVT
jgi:hypothetical protein